MARPSAPTAGLNAFLEALEPRVLLSNAPPTITSLTDSPDPVAQGQVVVLTANGVSDPDAGQSVASVTFYYDANNNGAWENTDTAIAVDNSSVGGWSWTGSTSGFPVGAVRLFAQAKDNLGMYSTAAATTAATTTLLVNPPSTTSMQLGSTTGVLPASMPTTSLILGGDLANFQAWWAAPVNASQTYWKATVDGRANQGTSGATPTTFATAANDSSIAKAAAFRWAMTGNAADLTKAVNVLKVAAVPGGTEITKTEAMTNYLLAYDFIRPGSIAAGDRSTIESALLSAANTLGGGTSDSNVRAKVGGTRGLAGVLLRNQALLNQGLTDLQNNFNYSTTDDGWFTDSQGHYLNYILAPVTAFVRAYQQGSGVDLYANFQPYSDTSIGMRLPNGAVPNVSNGLNTPVAIHLFSQTADAASAANMLWNGTNTASVNSFDVTNVINNDWVYTNFLALSDFTTTPAAPAFSPAFLADGQSGVSVFREDWSTTSDYLMLSPGVDSPPSWVDTSGVGNALYPAYHSQNDTGEVLAAANGKYILVAPGYDRRDLSNTPVGFDPKRADWHNVLLVDGNVGSLPGPAGSFPYSENPIEYGGPNLGRTTRPGDFLHTNRLDSTELGGFKGVGDFATLVMDYNNTQVTRSTGFPHEDYFVVADNMTSGSTHSYAFNLVGRGTQTVLTNTPGLVEVKWVKDGAQVIEHVLSTGGMSLGTTQLWMHDTYNVFEQTQRAQVGISGQDAGFLTILETGTAGAASKFNITNQSTADHTGTVITNAADGWTDTILSQSTMATQTVDRLTSDAKFAQVRIKAGGLDSAMISGGTSLELDGSQVLGLEHPATLSMSFVPGQVRGNISADGLATGTDMSLFGLSGIVGATIDGQAVPVSQSGGAWHVSLERAGALVIQLAPPNVAPVLVGANHLNVIDEDAVANPGTRVAAILEGMVSDANGPARGMAVTALNTANGSWQYSLNGSNWLNFSAVSASSALLLSADADTRVRFVPNADFNGTLAAGLTYRAWDASDGATEGSTADASVGGGTTAFSSATASAGIIVTARADAPTFTLGGAGSTVAEDSGAQSVAGLVTSFTPGSTNPQIVGNGYPAVINRPGLSVAVSDVAQIPASVDPVSSTLKPARLNFVFSANDGSGRLFVNDMRGKLWIIKNGVVQPTPFLDIAAARAGVFDDDTSVINSERGFSTFAFDPDFSNIGTPGYRKVYTVHTEFAGSGAADFGAPWGVAVHQDVLSEWTVSAGNPDVIDVSTRRDVMRLDQPRVDHNMNQIAFNPAAAPGSADYGKLYVGVGDGGNTGNDGPTFQADRFGDGQNRLIPFGKILRIDPHGTNGASGHYGLPTDNPFVGAADPANQTIDEIWALGFRNPQRFSWDPATGKMYIADIGQKNAEEVNLGVAGANYGWGDREGMFVVDHDPSSQTIAFGRPANDETLGYTYPVATYDRSEGIAIVGGFVYRGSAIPYLQGKYVFGDLNNGRMFYADVNDLTQGAQANIQELTLLSGGVQKTLLQIIGGSRSDLRFGLGGDGEIYLTTKFDGKVRMLGSTPQAATYTPPAALPSVTGPANLSNTTAAYTVSGVSNPGLFSVQPSVAPDGTLTYTPAPNANGTATFQITARDTGGTLFGRVDASAPRSFTVTVTPVNDPPTVGSLSASPSTVAYGSSTTLTAVGVADIDNAVAGVSFYRDANSDGIPQAGELLATASSGGPNWSTTVSTLGFPTGAATILAQATDASGALSNVVSGTLNVGQPAPQISIAGVSATEGNSGTKTFAFNVALSAPSNVAVTVTYATANGTASSSNDYIAASGTLTIPAGQLAGVINVSVRGDTSLEKNETFVVNLTNPANATIAVAQATGLIVTDDGTDLSWNSLASTPPTVLAPGGTFAATRDFQVSNAAVTQNFTLQYRLSQNSVWGDADDLVLTATPVESVTLAADKTVGPHAKAVTLAVPANALPAGIDHRDYAYLLGKVDSGAVVPENDLNNVITVAAPVTVQNPDLAWVGLSVAPATIDAGGRLTLVRSFEVKGQPVAPSFVVSYRLSLNGVYGDADDVVIGTETISAAADKTLGVKTKTLTFTVPAATAVGNYVLLAQLDSNAAVNEVVESNNLFAPAPALAVLRPDLAWNSLGVSPGSIDAGGKLTLVRNFQVATQAPTPNFTVAYRLSLNGTFGDADDVVLGTETISIAADKSVGAHAKTLTYTVPTGTAPGNYQLLAQLDSGNAVVETNEANNLFAPAPGVAVVRPDLSWNSLAVTSITPGTAVVARNFQVGSQAITPNFAIAYRLSLNAVFGDADDIVLGNETISAAADKTIGAKAKSVSFTVPALTAGQNYYLLAQLDSGNAVAEADEANNLFTRLDLAPTANNQLYATNPGVKLTVATANGLVARSSSPDGNALTAALVAGPSHGTLSLSTNGSFTYTPAAGYSGTDSFVYRVREPLLSSAPATVRINVPNAAPSGAVDAYSVETGTTLDVAPAGGLLANDTDANADPLTVSSYTAAGHGTVVVNPDGSFAYTPVNGYVGPDSFTYRPTDGLAVAGPVTVSLTVNPAAAISVTVRALGDQGWVAGDTRNGGLVNFLPAPAGNPVGAGSLHLASPASADKATLELSQFFGGLSNFGASYHWYRNAGAGLAAPAIKLGIDTSDANVSTNPFDAGYDKVLVYEPYQNHTTVDNTWTAESIDQNNGLWWLIDIGGAGANQAVTKTLGQWLNDPTYGARLSAGLIAKLQIGIGSDNPNLDSYVDDLRFMSQAWLNGPVRTTDVDFEAPVV
ncbi:MAG: Ig-like domain-containing protein [Planctomycetota bacterium]|nr:Ig-like domain-containing protein [Planctomycetota bacterium]